MNEDKMYLINKIFNDITIRTVWNKEEERNYLSIIDLVGALTESDRPRKYWSDLKNRLKQEGSEVSGKIGQLKLKSQDGKYRLTNVCDIADMFRIIEAIPSKNAEPIKLWLARLGGNVAKNTRNEIENLLGESVITNTNKLNYQYLEENKKIEH